MKTASKKSENMFVHARNAIIVAILFLSGFFVGRHLYIPGLSSNLPSVNISGDTKGDVEEINFNLFWNVWNTLSKEYVDAGKADPQAMFYGAIKGVVNSFDDPATIFLTPDETKTFNEGNAGRYFEGIGAELGYRDGQIVVIAPISGSPAQAAGIRSGDVILKVNGEDIKSSESIYDVVAKIRGEAGTKVVLTILHKGDVSPEEIEITRGQITVPSIEVKGIQGEASIKVIDIARFTDSSLDEWKRNWDSAVSNVIDSGSKGLILDLRGNPGGFFDAGIYSANEFVKKGTVLAKQADRNGTQREFKAQRDGRLLNIPVVVLVDKGSASASEILAGALKENNRVTIVGEDTYGKGTAQSIVTLSGGASLHITTMKWLLPDGSWLSAENVIKPDVKVEFDEDDFLSGKDLQLNKAVEELNKLIK